MTDYTILSHRVAELEKRVARLNKKGGNIVLTVVNADRLEKYAPCDPDIGGECWRSVADVSLDGLAPVIAGWTFLAALERLDNGQNVVTSAPGTEVPIQYRDAEPNCDHCGTNRRRIYTFILRSDSGEYKQVGKTCLQDFLRCSDAGEATRIFGLLGVLEVWSNLDEDGEDGGGRVRGYDALMMIAATVCEIRSNGWVSRSKALADEQPTADAVLDTLASKKLVFTDSDVEHARKTLDWVTDLEPKSDYEHNLKAILADGPDGFVRTKHAGFACSAVSAYNNAVARAEREAELANGVPSVHFGEIKKRYKGLTAKVTRISYTSGMYGTTTIVGLVLPGGEQLVWFASSGISGCTDEDALKGQTIKLDGTVKAHNEFRGVAQTQLTRCKFHGIVD